MDTFRWQPLTLPDAGQKLFSVDLYDSNNVFVVGNIDAGHAETIGGKALILKTEDGSSWAAVVSPSSQALRALTVADATTVFAVGDGQTIIRSREGGLTWERIRGS